jgi:RHS repeat-associated protein
MNQGTVIAAGSGGSGGDDANAGEGDDKEKASGEDGGNDAEGGQNGAGNCGPGSETACPIHAPSAKAGDPVDVSTGRVSTSNVDIDLPGLMPLVLQRKYSSQARTRDVGLGLGWTHSLGWEIEARGRTVIEVWDGDGTMLAFATPQPGGRSVGLKGWVLFAVGDGFELERQGLRWVFGEPDANRRRFRLLAVRDRCGNAITLRYADGCLTEIVDSVGRIIRVRPTPERRIGAFEIKNAAHQGQWVTFARYTYDDRGNLLTFTDADGYTTQYTYSDDGLLASCAAPDSLVFHFRYDRAFRCVETWGAMANGVVPALATSVPKRLADGRTPAKGLLHCKLNYEKDGYVEVADSLQVRRYFSNRMGLMNKTVSSGGVTTRQFDERGHLLGLTDPVGQTYKWTRDERGAVLTQTDPTGYTVTTRRGPDGQPVEISDGLGVIMRFTYDAHGNIVEISPALGERATFRYDDRGALVETLRPNGARLQFEYDAHYNMTRVVQPDGTDWQWTFDGFGRVLSMRDPAGAETRYAYDNRGLRIATYEPNGNVVRFTYNGARERIAASDAERSMRAEYNGFHQLVKLVYANGEQVQFRYDREARLVELINESGAVRSMSHNLDGLVTEIVSFDGRRERFKYDANGHLIWYENGASEVTKYIRDALGRIIEVVFPDETTAKFQLDPRGQVVKETLGGVEVRYQLDAAGQRVREVQSVDGREETVERAFDLMRECVRLKTSLGHAESSMRDSMERVERRALDAGTTVRFHYDTVGREVDRVLPGGAHVASEWSTEHRLVRVAVSGPAQPQPGTPEPDWVGVLPPNSTVFKAFAYSPVGRLTSRWDRALGSQEYKYDGRDRLLESFVNGQRSEAFGYVGGWNVSELASPRSYAPGDVLQAKGPFTFEWDSNGRLTSKTERLPDGSVRTWRYEWNGAGFLATVTVPDGRRVGFTYDPYGRRMKKQVWRIETDGARKNISTTRYVWDRAQLAHEIRESATAAGDPIVEERTYCFDDFQRPLAHRTKKKSPSGDVVGSWVYYVTDPIGTPETLVADDGRVLGTLERTAWGETTPSGGETTPLRFAGQYEDDETGLHYNRYRYYDPQIGRYISQDPAGNLPHPNLYRYAHNPILGIDPYGLHTVNNATWYPGDGSPPTSLGNNGTLNSTFDTTTRQQMMDPNFTPNAARYAELAGQPNGSSRACASAFAREHFSDTEAKAVRQATPLAGAPGGTLEMTGELPPCKHCQKRMTDFAATNNARVVYNHNGPGSPFVVDHRPGAVPGQ